jgi:hypothetical protein
MHRLVTLFIGIAAALMLFVSGCVVAERDYHGGRESYYYYPDYEVYYYPRAGWYYWYEGGSWRHDSRPPSRFVLNERDRVRLDWNREPHLDHDRIRRDYPGRRDDRDRDRDRDRERDRDRNRDQNRPPY